MTTPKFSEDVRPLTDLKTQTASIIDQAQRTRRPILLTRRGRGVAVLLNLGEYERLTERAAFVSAVEEGRQAAVAGDVHDNEEAMTILEELGRADA